MNNLRLYANIAISICMGIGFLHGAVRCFGKEFPMFLKAIIGAFGCMMAGRIFAVVLQICGGSSVSRLNLGYVGLVGCFLFLFSASHGEIDNRIKPYRNKKAEIIGYIAPLPILILLYMILKTNVSVPYKILGSFVSIFALLSVMYFFKYMIMPDGGDGLLNMLRPSCVMLVVFTYSQLGEIYFSIRSNTVMLIVTYALICIVGISLIPLTERRVSIWMNV